VNERERVMNAVTAYQLTSMLKGVVDRGTARSSVNLNVPAAGKTGTTNDAKDVWFVGFTSNIVAGCYIGFDSPQSLGQGASGGGMCGPVFQSFMQKAVAQYGGGDFRAPEECQFIKIDRFSGARLGDDASGDNVVSECFREGEEPVFGIQFDGGFAMSGSFASMLDNLNQDYVRTARAKGLSEAVVVNIHVLRNSMIPVVTVIALGIPSIFGGAIITENVFKVNGIGQLLITALFANDLPMVMTLTFIFAVLIVLFNLIADVLYGLLDPRIRYD
jgi:membrane peptidoglycan carboxypeptidase